MNRNKISVDKPKTISILSIVTADSQHTEKLWESEFSGSLKHEVVSQQSGQMMQLVPLWVVSLWFHSFHSLSFHWHSEDVS